MQPIGLNELREMYLKFFESKEHLRLPSSSLVPQNDPSLLLINSGMAPLKAYFTGAVQPPCKRVTTCQKCIRTPDIERVGKTARHGTFFEMLGNFSFGDYFKKDATAWAWEFVTEVLSIPQDKLWVTIYQEDDDAEEIWVNHVGVPREKIVRLGKSDNFWEHGIGPCGPCSEIYFDRGEKSGCGSPDCAVGCDCDRFVEFWNLVFTQFDRDEAGNYNPLANPNIDTGMGLERLAAIMQNVDNLFEVDTVQNILTSVANRAGVKYHSDSKSDISLRVITDHIRGTTFMIGDGVTPSNEGRGYVLRRLLRRAARHGILLGIKGVFLNEIANIVIDNNKTAYPELEEKREYITKTIKLEEERFGQTVEQGMKLLEEHIKARAISGADAFRLYDTYGFPLDLIEEILSDHGIPVDVDEFNRLMQEQRERARAARNNDSSWDAKSDNDEEKAPESDAHSRAHSATHLLQAALRKELGDHVFQKGSFVGEDRLRFDFSHFEPMTAEQLENVQNEVNKNVLAAMPSTISNVPLDEARKMGAIALFSEKYGDVVRVVQLGDVSIELCSGRHVENTGNIGLFKINSESGSAAGVRRIDASVGLEVLKTIKNLELELDSVSEKAQSDIKELKKEIKQLKTAGTPSSAAAETREINGIFVSFVKLDSSDSDILKSTADNLKSQHPVSLVAVGGADAEGVKFVVAASEAAVEKGAHAGNVVREIAKVAGGNGGGKPSFAQAGGTNADKIDEALAKIFELV